MDFNLTDEQQKMVNLARDLAEKEFKDKAARWDQKAEYPYENVEKLVDAGFCGMTIPEEYGGPGRPIIDAVLVVEEVAKVCGVTARIVVETNMGAIGAIMAYGERHHKSKYAPYVLRGDKPCIAISEPEAGTAATDMKTTAVLEKDNYIVNGVKHWITGGGISFTNLVFARIFQNGEDRGIGGVLVDKGTPGFRFGKVEDAMGLRGIPETELIFEDCRIPSDNLLVVKDGFKRLMSAYNGQRVGAATVALGIASGAFDLAVKYSQVREQFGRPICEFQGLMWMLADMRIQLDAARMLIYRAATTLENGFPRMTETSIAKAFSADVSFKVANDALQIFGAAGYSKDLPLERMVRDARMFKIGGGTSESQKNTIAQGILGRNFNWRRI
ncbi:acyl-CoA dehydrogenase family protein [Chloroflexota bacterium]